MKSIALRASARIRRALLLLVALALHSPAPFAQSTPLEIPPTDVCSTATFPAMNPGTTRATPGRWWNPRRSGTGWDLTLYAPGNKLALTWYTFDTAGEPIWLVAQPHEIADDGSYRGRLLRYRWTGSTRDGGTDVGEVVLRFYPGDPTRAALQWRWDASDSRTVISEIECIKDFARTGPTEPTQQSGLNAAQSGSFAENGADGWGIFANIVVPEDGVRIEVLTAALYDSDGQPVWVQTGANNAPVSSFHEFVLDYFRSNYPGGVPNSDCEENCVRTTSSPRWTLGRTWLVETNSLAVDIDIRSTEIGQEFARSIAWVRDAVLDRLSYDSVVVVDRLDCRIAAPAETCRIRVDWSSTDARARVFRFNLADSLDIVPIGTTSVGTEDDALPPGRYQYRLVREGDPSEDPAFSTPTVRAYSDLQPASFKISKSSVSVDPPDSAGIHAARYRVVVANTGGMSGPYGELRDVPEFPAGAEIVDASWSVSGTGAPAPGSASGPGPYVLATGGTQQQPGEAGRHEYVVTVRFRVPNASGFPRCAAADTPRMGLYNRAQLVGENDTLEDNDACLDLTPPATAAELDVRKVPASPALEPVADGSYLARFTIEVENFSSSASGSYTLTDSVAVPPELEPIELRWRRADTETGGTLSGPGPYAIVTTPSQIGAAARHRYDVAVLLRYRAGAPNAAGCGVPQGGIRNSAALGAGQESPARDGGHTACIDPPIRAGRVNASKRFVGLEGPSAEGRYVARYEVVVANATDVPTQYGPLHDVPGFDANLAIQSASWTVTGGAPQGQDDLADGVLRLAGSDTPIAAGATHRYAIEFVVGWAGVARTAAACAGAGTGLFNAITVSGAVVDAASACADMPRINLAKTGPTLSTPNAAGELTARYAITVINDGAAGRYSSLVDVPAFSPGVTIKRARWSGAATGSTTEVPAEGFGIVQSARTIARGEVHSYAVEIDYLQGAATAPECSGPRTGLHNSARLGAFEEHGSDADNSACAAIAASVVLGKAFVTLDPITTDGTYRAHYRVRVSNRGAATQYGPLMDQPMFGAGLTIESVNWTGSGGAPSGAATPSGSFTLAPQGTAIVAGVEHVYDVAIRFRNSGNATVPPCAANGGGLFNRVTAAIAGGTSTLDANACGTPPAPLADDDAEFDNLDDDRVAHDPTVGELPGQAATSGGAATYTIPIEVPPGRRGMAPALALTYSSRSGSGIAGMGMSVSGLSSIHRCPRTPEQDGAARSVDYSNEDRLCLDGQRLVLDESLDGDGAAAFTCGGVYGAANSCYRTEIDAFARIRQHGGDLASPATWFTVESKSGETSTFGTSNARSVPMSASGPGSAVPLSWLLALRRDAVGNEIAYSYLPPASNGESGLLDRIHYTGFKGTRGDRSVVLAYEQPDSSSYRDASIAYLGGRYSASTQRLTSIRTYFGAQPVRAYKVVYAPSLHSGRALARSVQVCAHDADGTETCRDPTELTWLEAPARFDPEVLRVQGMSEPTPRTASGPGNGSGNGNGNEERPPGVEFASLPAANITADFDGDGAREMIVAVPDGQTVRHQLVSLTADRAVAGLLALTDRDVTDALIFGAGVGDFDNDGRSDLPTVVDDVLHVRSWVAGAGTFNGGGFGAPRSTGIPYQRTGAFASSLRQAGDLDADGRIDVVVEAAGDGTDRCARRIRVWLNRTEAAGASPRSLRFEELIPSDRSAWCLKQNRTGPNLLARERIAALRDADGNGFLDVMVSGIDSNSANDVVLFGARASGPTCAASGGYRLCAGRYSQIFAENQAATAEELSRPLSFWLDLNGDGIEDLLYAGFKASAGCDASACWTYRLNTGAGLGRRIQTASSDGIELGSGGPTFRPRDGHLIRQADVDSDGRTELLVPNRERPFMSYGCTWHAPVKRGELWCPLQPPAAGGPGITPAAAGDPPCETAFYVCPDRPRLDATFFSAGRAVFSGDADHDGVLEERGLDEWAPLSEVASREEAFAGKDASIYRLNALRFHSRPNAPDELDVLEDASTNFASRADGNVGQDDVYGDGLVDGLLFKSCAAGTGHLCAIPVKNADLTPISAELVPRDIEGEPLFKPALMLAENLGAGRRGSAQSPRKDLPSLLPDVVIQVETAFGNTATWDYFPLSSAADRSAVQTPLYSPPSRSAALRYADDRHFYFTSSMPVVAEMSRSNGIGGENTTSYAYREAMYNARGRGFQGFRTIIEESHADGLRTATRFHQKFPLSGQIDEQTVTALVDRADTTEHIRRTTNRWRCNLAVRQDIGACEFSDALRGRVWFPYLDLSEELTFDADGATAGPYNTNPLTRTSTLNAAGSDSRASGFDAYGNLTEQIVTSSDGNASAVFVASREARTSRVFFAPDVSRWYLDRLDSESTGTSIAFAPGHALPSGIANPIQRTLTRYQFNDDRTMRSTFVSDAAGGAWRNTELRYRGEAGEPPGENRGLPTQSIESASSDPADAGSGPDQSGRRTRIGYSPGDYFPQTMTNELGHRVTTIARPRDGLPAQSTDPNGLATTHHYDAFGSLVAVDAPQRSINGRTSVAQPRREIAHVRCDAQECAAGSAYRVVAVQPGTPTTTLHHDVLGRVVREEARLFDGSTQKVDRAYDARGLLREETVPYRANEARFTTRYEGHDVLGRVTRKVAPATEIANGAQVDTTLVTEYDYVGRRADIRVYGGNSASCAASTRCLRMQRTSDVTGRIAETIDAVAGRTRYWFDGLGNALALEDANGSVVSGSYNALSQRTASNDPNMGVSRYVYDGFGDLLEQTDARGVTIRYGYDPLGRKVGKQFTLDIDGDGNLEPVQDVWDYDTTKLGLLGRSARSVGGMLERETQWSYDALSRPTRTLTRQRTSASSIEAFAEDTVYDAGYGRVRKLVYPTGHAVAHGYTRYGHLRTLANAYTGEVHREVTGVDARGQITAESLGALTRTSVHAPATGQVTAIAHGAGASPRRRLDYGYDVFGNLATQRLDARSEETFGYDVLHRLEAATRSHVAGTTRYAYDRVGNFRTKSDFSATGGYSMGSVGKVNAGLAGPNAVLAVQLKDGGTVAYRYDPSGNLIGDSAGFAARYDEDHRPLQATRGNRTNAFRYGPDGDRTRQAGDDGERIYLGKAYERVTRAGVVEEKVYLGDSAILTRKPDGSSETAYLLRDRLGSVDAIADAAGTILEARAYDAFGKPRNGDWTDQPEPQFNVSGATSRGFTQHEHLIATRLIHMNGRAYDYNLGRFLSVDPIIQFPSNSQSLNPYSYIFNNPLSGTDPTGYASCSVNDSQKCLESGSNRIYDDKGNYLGKFNVNGNTVTFAPTKAGFAYVNGGKSGSGASAERGTRAPSDVGGPSSSSRASGSPISETVSTAPIALGDDPNSDQTRDARGFGATVPGVGFAQCLSGSADCSGAQTAAQGAGAMLGFYAPGLMSRLGTFFRGAAAESPWLLGPAARGVAIENMLGHNLPKTFPTIDKFSNGLATSIKSLDLATGYKNPANISSTLNKAMRALVGFEGGIVGRTAVGTTFGGPAIVGRQLQVAIPAGYTMTAGQQAAVQSAAARAREQGLSFVVTKVR